ncbi:Orf115 [Heliothis zea nudivirus]|uniref:Orf115 n=1 Tax=Heliothis zea nudivirus 1 TaxID=3116536 RepID=Q8JKJ8_9VIRU|nr:Orf115 [Heliothis zea nudivirus]AAN04408.1 Orf115 [Heliothis zea nudivirus]
MSSIMKMNSILQLFDVRSPVAFHPSKLNPIVDSLNPDYENEQDRLYKAYQTRVVDVAQLDDFNRVYLDSLKKSAVTTKSICIDGMSAVGKSSIATRLDGKMLKPGSGSRLISRNSHPSSCMAYVFNFIKAMIEADKGGSVTLFDRLPFNTLMWNKIWLMLGRAEREGTIDEKHMFKYTDYLDSDVIESMAMLSFNIILVDSDFKRAAQRLRAREEGCDVERSQWWHYMPIQYFAYVALHARWPHLFYLIDLESFKGDQSAMQDYVVSLIKRIDCFASEGHDSIYKFEPIDMCTYTDAETGQRVPYVLCGDVKQERLRPLMDVSFTDGVKRFALRQDDSAHFVRFHLVEPNGVLFEVVDKNRCKRYKLKRINNGKLFASAKVCDPIGLWNQLVELSDGVLIKNRVLRFKNNRSRFEFVKMLQKRV